MPCDVRDRAVRAAVETAAAHGVRACDPVVLADGFNVLVRLRPAPVVARVMTVSSVLRPRGDQRIARELAVAEFLAARGIPVSRPTSEVPPGPHRRRGLWLSFWQHLDVDSGAEPDPELVGARLRELHRALRDYSGSGAVLDVPLSDVREFLRLEGTWRFAEPGDLAAVERRLDALLPRLETSGTCHRWLHGDAHPGNLLRANGEWVWTDFEECVFGPVEWDLACLRRSRRIDGAAAARAYGSESPDLSISGNAGEIPEASGKSPETTGKSPERIGEPGVCGELRELQAAAWLVVLAERFPESGRRAREVLDGLV